ncbi:hypothetical protein K4A83_13635 [Spirulina subsalsa FACHB-351]|uniref:Glycosyltransferase RgtA/B/C/D-like domain-containing protein n=1 Tax=Spirulina subsalsa FACHB-351 TaxID=234711 RepID=A0ABT3L736_9CYAN|nr:hypothetical protein [Spirulina subsalsa]MCW6037305.1 hypothetical protein [Spirulina subsalsa FACHB-351]
MTQKSLTKNHHYLFVYVFFVALTLIFLHSPYYEGDTIILVQSVSDIEKCLNNRVYTNCNTVIHFPIFQFVPAFLLSKLGVDQPIILRILATINTISFFGSILLFFKVLSKLHNSWIANTGLLIMISSPLLWYAQSTFNEMTATFITLGFTASLLINSPVWLIAILSFLVGITKETAFPFVVAISILILYPNFKKQPKRFWFQMISVITGIIGSFTINSVFNYFRYRSYTNTYLLQDQFIVTDNLQKLSNFLGLWLSPNGGILFFWTSFFLYTAAIVYFLFFKNKKSYHKLIPITLVIGTLGLLTYGLSNWWAPFGWYSWGPRLVIPWIPSLLIVTINFYPQETTSILEATVLNKFTHRRILFMIFFLLISLPNIVILNHPEIMVQIFTPDATCPETPFITDLDYYYFCLNHYMWTKYPSIIDSFTKVFQNIPTFMLYTSYIIAFYQIQKGIQLSNRINKNY